METPIQQFDGKDLYPSFLDKLSILFYLLIKNHPFVNGNKRMALTAVLVILFLNNMWLNSNPLEIYKLAKSVAKSDRKNMENDRRRIKKFIGDNLVPLKKRR
ncbi:type II toxin-antitoxin system death-on-curing family toxin [Candidatus Woesebacteria bacterium]|nr:type II toxin-antitoxin system death-on-curing family toxin [Candidatus Woesebacteria bacterium]